MVTSAPAESSIATKRIVDRGSGGQGRSRVLTQTEVGLDVEVHR
jgi:hypothetical protein